MRRPGVVEWGTGGVKKRETGWGGRLCKTRTSVAPCGAAQMGSNGNLSSSCVPSASVARPLSGFASRRRSGVTPDHRAAACRAPERACGGGGRGSTTSASRVRSQQKVLHLLTDLCTAGEPSRALPTSIGRVTPPHRLLHATSSTVPPLVERNEFNKSGKRAGRIQIETWHNVADFLRRSCRG